MHLALASSLGGGDCFWVALSKAFSQPKNDIKRRAVRCVTEEECRMKQAILNIPEKMMVPLPNYQALLMREEGWQADAEAVTHAEKSLECRILVVDIRNPQKPQPYYYDLRQKYEVRKDEPRGGYVLVSWNGGHYELLGRFASRSAVPRALGLMFNLSS